MMCLVVLRVEHANHSTPMQPDGFYTTSLLSALETAACLPAHLLAGSKVPLWLALKRGEEEGQRVESVCGREERKKKTGTTLKYTSFSLLTVEYCHLHKLGFWEFQMPL